MMLLTEKELLNELFAIPINPQLVAILDGELKLYSSQVLVNKYKESLYTNHFTKPSFKFLNRMIDKQILTPTYLTKGLLSYSFSKIFGNKMDNINAFYSPEDNRIFILLENNTTFGFTSNDWMGKLTIHECMHMACAHGKSRFLKIWYNEYAHYYNVFFHLLSNVKITPKTTNEVAKDIDIYVKNFHIAEVSKRNLKDTVNKIGMQVFHNIMTKLRPGKENKQIIKLTQEGYKKLITMFVNYGVAGLVKSLQDPACKYIIQTLQQTYPAISQNKVNTLAIQELIFPSEIAAVFSELGISSSNVKKSMSMIKV